MTSGFSRPHRVGLLIAVFSAVTFGLCPAAVRGMYASGANPVFAVIITTWSRGLFLAAFCLIRHKPSKRLTISGRR